MPNRFAHAVLLALLLPSTPAWSETVKPPTAGTVEATENDADEEAVWDVNDPGGQWNTINIDARETTWSSVDVSPDGSTVIFDALGDIYAVPLGGGIAQPLTTGIAWNIQPKFSPDGKHITFISDRSGADNIWTMTVDGNEPNAVTDERDNLLHNPSWSPDGQWIVARKGYVSTRSIPSAELWRYHFSGGKGVQVVERPHGEQSQKNIAEPAFSPDGRYIYFTQDTTAGRVFQYNRDSTAGIYVIQRYDRQRNKTETLTGGPGGAVRPTPSPDGKTLAFVRRLPSMKSALFLKDLESGNERIVYDQLDRDEQESFGVHGISPAFAWTPDSASLVFWAGGKIRRIDADGSDLRHVNLRLKVQKQVRDTVRFPVDVAPDKFPVKMTRWAQYSPDGRQVVFQALGHLYVKNVASGQQRRLTKQTDHFEFWPSFSANGRSIVYTTWDDEQLGSVRVVNSNGGEGRPVTSQPGHYVEPRFSNDRKQIVYRKISGGYLLAPMWSVDPGIYRISVRGGQATRLSESGHNPQFSTDGDRVLFSTTVETTHLALKSVDLNGLDERDHAQAAQGTEYSVSPDGRWLAFVEQNNAHVLPFSLTAQVLKVSAEMKSVPVRQVSKRAGEFITWSADSDSLNWSNGPILYRRQLADAFAFIDGAPDELPDPVSEGLDLSFEVAADKPNSVIALKGARIVTMRNAQDEQEVIEGGVIVIDGNRIKAVGSSDDVTIPAGAFELNLNGKTVIPGLIDGHAHGGTANNELTPEQNWLQMANLAFGVTTIHDPSNDTSEIFAFSELQRSGAVLGPRTYSTGTILYGALQPSYTAVVNNYDDALFHLQRLKDSGAVSVKSYNQLARDSRQQIIAAAAELGMMVVPEGGGKFQHNLTHIVDGHTSIEHSIPLANLYDDVTQLWSQTGTSYVPTLGVAYGGIWGENYWYDKTDVFANERLLRYAPKSIVLPRAIRGITAADDHYNHINVAREAKKLRDAGVLVVTGAHGQREGLAEHWELWMLEQGGFSPWEALRAGTIDAAAFIGMDRDIGSIEVGKLADLVVIDGNPLQDLKRSEFVDYTMINGRLYEVATMTEVGSGSRQREPFFFESEGGEAFPATTGQALKSKAQRYHWSH